ncbi:UNKNOWN [Stylonychia lemnae]|uniref:Uncharacterized protein n=1 Tax=Stylonychia lemnae TaxID=5949 RepID=A0A078AQ34_STYLE|nr:UNKNOWN [Stylonychia lemnae]|eukprot:CDW84485.1 UNKNOWN [Stylonychia lemnae]
MNKSFDSLKKQNEIIIDKSFVELVHFNGDLVSILEDKHNKHASGNLDIDSLKNIQSNLVIGHYKIIKGISLLQAMKILARFQEAIESQIDPKLYFLPLIEIIPQKLVPPQDSYKYTYETHISKALITKTNNQSIVFTLSKVKIQEATQKYLQDYLQRELRNLNCNDNDQQDLPDFYNPNKAKSINQDLRASIKTLKMIGNLLSFDQFDRDFLENITINEIQNELIKRYSEIYGKNNKIHIISQEIPQTFATYSETLFQILLLLIKAMNDNKAGSQKFNLISYIYQENLTINSMTKSFTQIQTNTEYRLDLVLSTNKFKYIDEYIIFMDNQMLTNNLRNISLSLFRILKQEIQQLNPGNENSNKKPTRFQRFEIDSSVIQFQNDQDNFERTSDKKLREFNQLLTGGNQERFNSEQISLTGREIDSAKKFNLNVLSLDIQPKMLKFKDQDLENQVQDGSDLQISIADITVESYERRPKLRMIQDITVNQVISSVRDNDILGLQNQQNQVQIAQVINELTSNDIKDYQTVSLHELRFKLDEFGSKRQLPLIIEIQVTPSNQSQLKTTLNDVLMKNISSKAIIIFQHEPDKAISQYTFMESQNNNQNNFQIIQNSYRTKLSLLENQDEQFNKQLRL